MNDDQTELGFEKLPYSGLPPFEKSSDTSRAAALAAIPHASALRGKVLEHVCKSQGATCSEVEVALGLSHQSASARIRELVMGGHLKDSGIRRKTIYGRNAVVWTKTP